MDGTEMTKSAHAKYIVVIAILGATVVWLAARSFPAFQKDGHSELNTASIVVLPFVNIGQGDPSGNLAATITADLTDELSKSSQFSVLPASVAARFAGRQLSIREIGDELLVTYVIEGGVTEASGQIRITIHLINARTDEHVWSESYQVDAGDVSRFTASAKATISSKLQ
jgi:TolB-like protein